MYYTIVMCGTFYIHPYGVYHNIVSAYYAYKRAKCDGNNPIICRVGTIEEIFYCNKHNYPGVIVY